MDNTSKLSFNRSRSLLILDKGNRYMLHKLTMAPIIFPIIIILQLTILSGISCQSYGTIPTALTRIESKLDDVSETSTQLARSTNQTATVLNDHIQQLDTVADQQNVQNQILSQMALMLQGIMEQQSVQNQILNRVVDLLEKHDKQVDHLYQEVDDVTEQITMQTQILSNMTSLLEKQDDQMEKQDQQLENVSDLLSIQQGVQTQVLGTLTSSLQNMTKG